MGKRVLVVDDNVDVVYTMVTLLKLEGHQAEGLSNATRIVQDVLTFDADVVILDIAMPGKSGWEAAKEIRSAIPGHRPLLIAVTGEYTKGTDKVLSEIMGFNYYLAKPADPKVLVALVEKAPAKA